MKKYIATLIIGLTLATPIYASPREDYRNALLQLIDLLQKQVSQLVIQLQELNRHNQETQPIQTAQPVTLSFSAPVTKPTCTLIASTTDSDRPTNSIAWTTENASSVTVYLNDGSSDGSNLIWKYPEDLEMNGYKQGYDKSFKNFKLEVAGKSTVICNASI